MSRIDDIRINSDDISINEMNDLEDWCNDSENTGSHYPGMSYEQGIRDTLEWLSGETGVAPHDGA